MAKKENNAEALQCNTLYKDTVGILSNARTSYKKLIQQIESVVKSILLDTEKVIKIDKLINDYRAQQPNDESVDNTINDNLNELASKDGYNSLIHVSQKLQNRVANIMRHISFEENTTAIYKAIAYYQAKNGNITKTAPSSFMTTAEQNALEDKNGKFLVSLYKVLLYEYAADALRSGEISLEPSYRYLSLENYMYSIEEWSKDRVSLLALANLTHFQDITKLLAHLQQITD